MKSTTCWATAVGEAEVGAGDRRRSRGRRRWPARPAGGRATARAAARPSEARRNWTKRGPRRRSSARRLPAASPRGAPSASSPAASASSSASTSPSSSALRAASASLGALVARPSAVGVRLDDRAASNSSTSPRRGRSSPGTFVRSRLGRLAALRARALAVLPACGCGHRAPMPR